MTIEKKRPNPSESVRKGRFRTSELSVRNVRKRPNPSEQIVSLASESVRGGIYTPRIRTQNDSDAEFGLPKFFGGKEPTTEDEHQLVVMTFCRTHPKLKNAFHIPNGGKRSKTEAARLKAIGVKAGVSDLFIPVVTSKYAGLWIELKALDGKPSEKQLAWLQSMNEAGYMGVLAYGYKNAIAAICDYLGETNNG